jgi:hypothetical protein
MKQSALDHQTAILFQKNKQIPILVSCKELTNFRLTKRFKYDVSELLNFTSVYGL